MIHNSSNNNNTNTNDDNNKPNRERYHYYYCHNDNDTNNSNSNSNSNSDNNNNNNNHDDRNAVVGVSHGSDDDTSSIPDPTRRTGKEGKSSRCRLTSRGLAHLIMHIIMLGVNRTCSSERVRQLVNLALN